MTYAKPALGGALLAWALVNPRSLVRTLVSLGLGFVVQAAIAAWSIRRSNSLKTGRNTQTAAPEDLEATPTVAGWRPRVLVCGGSGRLGLASARYVVRRAFREGAEGISIVLAGRSASRGAKAVAELKGSDGAVAAVASGLDLSVEFVSLDIRSQSAVSAALEGCSLVLHCAGPFAGDEPDVLPAAIAAGCDYVDICDDNEYAKHSLSLGHEARKAHTCGLITTGIQPGFSSLMGSEVVARLGGEAESVKFSYQVAGTGGSGPGILASTFMLCGEPVIVYEGGRPVVKRAASDERWVEFGPGVGKRMCFLLPVPEIRSCHEALAVPNVEVRFGTAPEIFNRANQLMALLPKFILLNRKLMYAYSNLLLPVCRVVDACVGATTAMHVKAVSKDGKKSCTMVYAHDKMVDCIGISVATFAWDIMQRRRAGLCPDGVFYPEELYKDDDRRAEFFRKAKEGAFLYSVEVEDEE